MYNYYVGGGSPNAGILVVLDNPGCREDREGIPFVCGTRQILQLATHTAGLQQKDLYITYILKCRPLRKYDKESARLARLGYLERQLETHDFVLSFCLGDTAVKAYFADPEKSVKNTRGTWHYIRGLPAYTSYHPLAVRRRPNLYGNFIRDWEEVARMAKK